MGRGGASREDRFPRNLTNQDCMNVALHFGLASTAAAAGGGDGGTETWFG